MRGVTEGESQRFSVRDVFLEIFGPDNRLNVPANKQKDRWRSSAPRLGGGQVVPKERQLCRPASLLSVVQENGFMRYTRKNEVWSTHNKIRV